MNCPRCAKAMAAAGTTAESEPSLFHCTHCDLHFETQPDDGIAVIGEPVGANCPVCRSPLLSAQIEGETVAHCGQCGGFMAEMEAFQVIVTKRRSYHTAAEKCTDPIDPEELERVLACPSCDERMDTHPYFGGGNVVVETCERCSLIWLGAGKLAFIERYVPYAHQIERTLTPRGGRYMGGPRDMPSLGYFLDGYWKPRTEPE